MATVEFDHVGKLYGTSRALTDIHFAVGDGEFLVLVGPSGCGKSTLLRSVAGLEEIDEGELRIGGRRANEIPPKDRDIAMVFQSYALYPHMTVRQNMAFGLEVRKLPRAQIESRVAEAARLLEIGGLLDRLPRDMSGGQRQRVAMGRAIVRQPQVFLFDEPLSNLDASLRSQMRAELKDLHARLGTTMLYVTHDQVEAMTLADRIAVLRGGVLQQLGTPQELFDRPQNRFVAGFLGSPSMNFLPGRVDGDGFVLDGERLDGLPLPPPGEVILGIRPHELVVGATGLPATVRLVEPMGWESHVHLDVLGRRALARIEGVSAPEAGSVVRVRPSAAFWFAPGESGAALAAV